MKTKFYLRKCSEKSIINFEFRSGTKIKFRPSTGFKINNEKDWDSVKQRMKTPSANFNANLINSKLSEFDNLLSNLIYKKGELGVSLESVSSAFYSVFDLDGKSSGKFQNDCFKLELDAGNSSKDFLLYYQWFLDFYSKNNSPYSKKLLTKGTLITLRSSMNVIKGFLHHKNLKKLYFDDINRNFYNDFIDYLTNEKKYTKNYIGTVIQKLKTVMGYAYEEGKHSNLEFRKNYFSKVTEVVSFPFLNNDELKKIESLDLVNEELDTVRDIFLIGCNTGLRIGDLLQLLKKPEIYNQDGRDFFKIKQSKTSNLVVIPINSVVKRIIEKRNGLLPNYIHQNTVNKHIKSICKRAMIVEKFTYVRTEGGVEVEFSAPKYKFVCSHTARRSFCTNAYYSGMPPHDIMAISGHKKEDVFYNYIKVSKQENALRISNYAFLQ
jgi:integrase